MDFAANPLLTDLYQLNMMQAYVDHGEVGPATFEFLVRDLPAQRGFLVAAGLDPLLDYLETLRFSPGDIAWLASTGRFKTNFLEYLADFRFTGDVDAMPEGTIFCGHEPILRITASSICCTISP
jgi:nicotinate phosphoribosyltransferase